MLAFSCIGPKALAGPTLVSMLEPEEVSYTDPDRSREVPDDTIWAYQGCPLQVPQ